jgi:hypothetical protein
MVHCSGGKERWDMKVGAEIFCRRNFLSTSEQLQTYENGIGPQSWLAIYGPKMDQTSSQNSGFPSA